MLTFNAAASDTGTDEKIKWEWRVFWPSDCPHAADYGRFSFLGRAPDALEKESDADTYIFREGSPLDIKLRDGDISYKKLVSEDHGFYGFTKKHHFQFPIDAGQIGFIPGFAGHGEIRDGAALKRHLSRNPHGAAPVFITKERATASFTNPDHPEKKAKAEFATLEINGKRFQTLSIESSHLHWLKKLAAQIDTTGGYVMDYPGFLSFAAPSAALPRRALTAT